MPTYEYRCSACNREFEYQQKMSDPDMVRCEACGTDTLERLISWTSVRNNAWMGALHTDNPKESMKGIAAVDRSRLQRFNGHPPAEPVAPADAGTATARNDADASATNDATGSETAASDK